jgi:hypothetical protein
MSPIGHSRDANEGGRRAATPSRPSCLCDQVLLRLLPDADHVLLPTKAHIAMAVTVRTGFVPPKPLGIIPPTTVQPELSPVADDCLTMPVPALVVFVMVNVALPPPPNTCSPLGHDAVTDASNSWVQKFGAFDRPLSTQGAATELLTFRYPRSPGGTVVVVAGSVVVDVDGGVLVVVGSVVIVGCVVVTGSVVGTVVVPEEDGELPRLMLTPSAAPDRQMATTPRIKPTLPDEICMSDSSHVDDPTVPVGQDSDPDGPPPRLGAIIQLCESAGLLPSWPSASWPLAARRPTRQLQGASGSSRASQNRARVPSRLEIFAPR